MLFDATRHKYGASKIAFLLAQACASHFFKPIIALFWKTYLKVYH